MPVILLRRLKQEDCHEFKTSLDYSIKTLTQKEKKKSEPQKKGLGAKPVDLNSIPWIHMWKKTDFLQVILTTCGSCYMWTHTNTDKYMTK